MQHRKNVDMPPGLDDWNAHYAAKLQQIGASDADVIDASDGEQKQRPTDDADFEAHEQRPVS